MTPPDSRKRTFMGAVVLVASIALLKPVAFTGPLSLPYTDSFQTAANLDLTASTAQYSPEQEAVLMAFKKRQYGFPELSAGSDLTADAHATFALAIGDLDGDGDLDVVAGSLGQANRVYLNNGTADPFAGVTGSDLTADAHETYSVAVADLDGDGDLDVVAGNLGQTNRVYLNNGTADPFNGVTGSDLTADLRDTRALAVADLDGDGDLDVVEGTENQTNRVYLNNGTADPFNGVTGSDLTADAHNTYSVAVGDFDGDGNPDVIAGNHAQPNRVYLNNNTAAPFSSVTGSDLTADAHATTALAVADLDGDGALDVVAGNFNQTNRVYLNNGTANPFSGVAGSDLTADTHYTVALAVADLDGDGDLDVVAGNGNQANRVYLNNGTADPFSGVTGSDLTADAHSTLALALADLDGDGDLDAVAGNFNQANRVYLNEGSANPFNGVTGSDLTADAHRTQVFAVADLDGDGDLDVVAGNQSAVNRVYLNNGTAAPFSGVTGSDLTADAHSTFALAVADLDGDGDLDVVAGNNAAVNRVYLNNGTADPFHGVTGSDLTADADRTKALAVADLDGDGDLDVIAGNDINQVNRVYLNNGTVDPFHGVAGSDLTADAHWTRELALADLDGDGDPDVIVGNYNHADRVYLNNGTADPFHGVTGSDLSTDAYNTKALAVADLDADGDLDVVAGNENSVVNRVYLNNGTADPFHGVTGSDLTADAHDTQALAVADLDADGDLDIVAGNSNQTNRVYLNNGTADPFSGITGSHLTADTGNTLALSVADLDGDGDLDVVAGNWDQANRLYLNNGKADPFSGLTGGDLTANSHDTLALAVADLDGDGDLDVIAGDNEFSRLYLNNGTPDSFNGVVGSELTGDMQNIRALAVGDLDGDGDLDVVVGTDGGINRVFLNNGTAAPFSGVAGSYLTADAHNTIALAVADLDGDGDLDVLAGNEGQANRIYLNNGTADPFNGVTGSDLTTDANSTNTLAAADLDGDGDLDVVAGNEGQANRVYLNNGTADPFNSVTGSDLTADAHNTIALAVADLDGDGDLDVVAANNGAVNRVYLNNGTVDPFHGVAGSDLTTDVHNTTALAVADLDQDGDLDVVAGNDGQANRVYLSNGTADPFNGVTGSNLSADVHNTSALAVADLDGDGALEVIAGNRNQPNRIYRRGIRYNTAAQRVISRSEVTPEYVPATAGAPLIFTAEHDVPPGTSIDYYLSNDGGLTWRSVRSGASVFLLPGERELKWRAEMQSLSPVVTPVLHSVVIKSPPQLSAAPLLAAEASPALSAAEAADGTVVTVPLDARYVFAGDTVSVYWGAAAAVTGVVGTADVMNRSVDILVDSSILLSQGEGSMAVTATVADAWTNTSLPSPAVVATVDFTAPGAPGTPVLSTEATDGVLDALEALDGTLVSVGLTGTGAVTGDTVTVVWNGATTSKPISSGDVAAQWVAVTVPATVIGSVQLQSVNLHAYLTDLAGNLSGNSPSAAAMVSTDGGDQDGDGLKDSDEVLHGTNPTVGDTDGDGLADGLEVVLGADPTAKDTDGDGLLDGWEFENGTSLLAADDTTDPDGDSLTNSEEHERGTNPLSADSDNDGLPDAYEIEIGSDPTVADSDADTDGDGVSNREQFYADNITSSVTAQRAPAEKSGGGCNSAGQGNLGTGAFVVASLLVFRSRRRPIG